MRAPRAASSYFAGKTIWIIGASGGIGAEIARRLSLFHDVRLLLSARNTNRLEAVAAFCRERGASCQLFPFSLNAPIDGSDVYRQARERFPTIDCVLFVAGVSQRVSFADAHFTTLEVILQTNFLSHMAIAHAIMSELSSSTEEQRGGATVVGDSGDSGNSDGQRGNNNHEYAKVNGQLVFVGSLAGHVSTPLRSAYSASKAALHSLAETLAIEAESYHVKVQLVVPGFVRTDISRNALRADGNQWQVMDTNQQQGMTVEVCAKKIIRFLASNSFMQTVGIGVRGKISLLLRKISPALLRRVVKRARTT